MDIPFFSGMAAGLLLAKTSRLIARRLLILFDELASFKSWLARRKPSARPGPVPSDWRPKTFEEACTVMMHLADKKTSSAETQRISDELEQRMASHSALQEEIQHSKQAHALAFFLYKNSRDMGLSSVQALVIAFSHGVMVGIEMEKQPLLVERSQHDAKPESD